MDREVNLALRFKEKTNEQKVCPLDGTKFSQPETFYSWTPKTPLRVLRLRNG